MANLQLIQVHAVYGTIKITRNEGNHLEDFFMACSESVGTYIHSAALEQKFVILFKLSFFFFFKRKKKKVSIEFLKELAAFLLLLLKYWLSQTGKRGFNYY